MSNPTDPPPTSGESHLAKMRQAFAKGTRWLIESYALELFVVIAAAYMRVQPRFLEDPFLFTRWTFQPLSEASKIINAVDWSLALLVATTSAFVRSLRNRRSKPFTISLGFMVFLFAVAFSNEFHAQATVQQQTIAGISRASTLLEQVENATSGTEDLRDELNSLQSQVVNFWDKRERIITRNMLAFSIACLVVLFAVKTCDSLLESLRSRRNKEAYASFILVLLPAAAIAGMVIVSTAMIPVGNISVVDVRGGTGHVISETISIDNKSKPQTLRKDARTERTFRHDIEFRYLSLQRVNESTVREQLFDLYSLTSFEPKKVCIVPVEVPAFKNIEYEIVWIETVHEGRIISVDLEGQSNTVAEYRIITDMDCQVSEQRVMN